MFIQPPKTPMNRSRRQFTACMPLLALAPHLGRAAEPMPTAPFPNDTVRIVVGFSPGGVADVSARIVGQKLSERWKQAVVVDNRPGAGSAIGAQFVAQAKPDGLTLLSVSAAHAALPALNAKLGFDPGRDFAGVALTCTGPLLLVATPGLGVKSVKDLLSLVRAQAGQINFASAGKGSATHFAMELFKAKTGADIVHVPYKGIPEALNDTVHGRVQLFILPLLNALPLVKDQKLVALGVTTAQRSPLLPDVPTLGESGVAGYRWESWHGLLAPAKTPRSIVNKLNEDILQVLDMPDVRARIAALGLYSPTQNPEQFDRFIAEEINSYVAAARAAQLTPE
jgi:tripartite-type tricarboxylate transporter receptor subunit TctC